MAVEALGSVMSVQAQSAVPTKTTAPKESVRVENTATVQETPVVDKTIGVVEAAQGKENASYGEKAEQEQKNEQLQKAVEQLNKSMPHSEAVFGMHEETNRVTIKIVDKETREVIKEVPPEKTLDMIAKVWELAGILVDEKR